MKLLQSSNATGLSIYAIAKQKWEALYFDAGAVTPAFVAEPTSPYITFTEDAVIKGFYQASIATSWADGRYIIAVYKQSGANPSPVADGEPDLCEVDVKSNFMYVMK
jgi:hypothetical protein